MPAASDNYDDCLVAVLEECARQRWDLTQAPHGTTLIAPRHRSVAKMIWVVNEPQAKLAGSLLNLYDAFKLADILSAWPSSCPSRRELLEAFCSGS